MKRFGLLALALGVAILVGCAKESTKGGPKMPPKGDTGPRAPAVPQMKVGEKGPAAPAKAEPKKEEGKPAEAKKEEPKKDEPSKGEPKK